MDYEFIPGKDDLPANSEIVTTTRKATVLDRKTNAPKEVHVLRCVGTRESNILNVNKIGSNTEVEFLPSKLSKGVDPKKVHDFNVKSGWCKPDSDTSEKRKSESKRVSVSRSIASIRLLVANNQWELFFSLTLSPEKWDRRNPTSVQQIFKEMSRRIKRKQIGKQKPYKGFKYLVIPEAHADGSIHFHGFLHCFPPGMLLEYTQECIHSSTPLPQYIVDKVTAGGKLYHCPEWDDVFGYNILEPIIDQDRSASYVTKYVSKDIGNLNFPTRYWCSRDLMKKITVHSQSISGCPDQDSRILNDVRSELYDLASTQRGRDGKGKKLYTESYISLPRSGADSESEYLSSISAIVDKRDMTRSAVIEHLKNRFS